MGNHYVKDSSPCEDLMLTIGQVMKTVRSNMAAGKTYTLKLSKTGEEGKGKVRASEKVRCVKVYPHIVCFVNKKGERFSLTYSDVYNMLLGRTIKM